MKNNITFYPNSLVIISLVLIFFGTGILDFGSPCYAQSPWTKKVDMPTGRFNMSTCVVDGKIYVIGGAAGSVWQALGTVEVYDPATDTWDTTKTDMPTARMCFSTSVVNGKIYAIGGGFETVSSAYEAIINLSTVEEYDPATDTWIKKDDMPFERSFHTANVLDGRIYIIGGTKSSGSPLRGYAYQTVDVYDPATDTWTHKGNIPDTIIRKRFGYAHASVVDGKIYVIGGYGGLDNVHEYDPVTDTWIRKADMPTKRIGHSTSALDGKIYALGGHPGSSPYPALASVEIYDPATDTWTTASDLHIGRCGLNTSVVDGKIYTFGGYTGDYWMGGPMGVTVEEYDPHKDLLSLVEKVSVNKGYAKAGSDSICIIAKMRETTGLTLLAEIESPDQSPVDSLQLYDDGNHNDGNAGDSLFANFWPVISTEEKHYYIDLHMTRVDTDTAIQKLDNMILFTTIGPIQLVDHAYIDRTYDENYRRQRIDLVIQNNGQYTTAENIEAILSTSDQRVKIIVMDKKPFNDCEPGLMDTCSSNYAFDYAEGYGPESTMDNPIQFDVTIYSDDIPYWTDSFDYVSTLVTIEDEVLSPMPQEFVLFQNYPNPFNPVTMINYQLPITSEVELCIYNLIGQKMTTQVSERQPAGTYRIEWDGSGFASGIYYYCIKTDQGFTQTKKLILLK